MSNIPKLDVPIIPPIALEQVIIKTEVDTDYNDMNFDYEEYQLREDALKYEKIEDEVDKNIQHLPFRAESVDVKRVPVRHCEAHFEECHICGRTVKYLDKHLESHDGSELEECTVCGKQVKHLEKHMEVHDDDHIVPIKCNICDKEVKYLDRHMEMHENKKYACPYCIRVFARKCYVQTHIREKHKGMPYEEMEVDEEFVKQRKEEAENDPERIASRTCTLCGFVCKTNKGLTNHKWQKHKNFTALTTEIPAYLGIKEEIINNIDANANFKCSFCGILCKLSQSLTMHLASKHNKTPEDNILNAEMQLNKQEPEVTYQCTECGIICKTAKTLSNHHQYKHRNEQFACEHCTKIFACKPYLKLHIRLMHQPVTLIKCLLCDELFKRKSSLSRHMKTHIPKSQRTDKQFPCELCQEVYNTKRDLLEHIKVTHKSLNCYMCGQVFFSKVEFGKHVITHEDYNKQVELRPFACEICGKRFQNESYCKSHKILQHTNDGNINKCADCGKEFLNAVLLKKHRRNHARKYKCHICSVTCLRKAKLDKHLAIHTTDTAFKCKYCNSSFQARVALHSHLRWHAANDLKLKSENNVEDKSTIDIEEHFMANLAAVSAGLNETT